MTDNNHPITPPEELVKQWQLEGQHHTYETPLSTHIATQAARWGADHELEACCAVVDAATVVPLEAGQWLRAARRPKPMSLKEQALLLCNDYIDPEGIIRRALEQLND